MTISASSQDLANDSDSVPGVCFLGFVDGDAYEGAVRGRKDHSKGGDRGQNLGERRCWRGL